MRQKNLIWINRYCLLDSSSGAAITARQQLIQLKNLGWKIEVFGATVFDSLAGKIIFEQNTGDIPQVKYFKIVDEHGIEHTLVKTASWNSADVTNADLNLLFSLYYQRLNLGDVDIVYYYGGNVFELLIASEARSRAIKTACLIVNNNYLTDRRWCRDVDLVISDSLSTARLYKEKLNLHVEVAGTFVEKRVISADPKNRKNILFVNPVFSKGSLIVGQIALILEKIRPDITLEVVESRGSWEVTSRAVTKAFTGNDYLLSNVVITPAQKNLDIQYARAKIVLVPSLAWESGARVIVESLLNGIPVIVTPRGGNVELMGDAGIIIDFDTSIYNEPFNKMPPLNSYEGLIEKIMADSNLKCNTHWVNG